MAAHIRSNRGSVPGMKSSPGISRGKPHNAISASTRSGCVAASRTAGAASELPMTTARREPAASSTARKSSTRCCTVGMPATGSDRPVPGLSKSSRRPIDQSPRRNSVA